MLSPWGTISATYKWLNVWGQLAQCRAEHYAERERNLLLQAEVTDLRAEINSIRAILHVGTICCDEHGRIVEAGANFAKMSGYPMRDLNGMHIGALIRPHDCPDFHDKDTDRFMPRVVDTELRLHDGSCALVTVSWCELLSGSGSKYRADFRRRP